VRWHGVPWLKVCNRYRKGALDADERYLESLLVVADDEGQTKRVSDNQGRAASQNREGLL
jgi:hypothetical protein